MGVSSNPRRLSINDFLLEKNKEKILSGTPCARNEMELRNFTTSNKPDGSLVISVQSPIDNGNVQSIKPTPITLTEGFFGNMEEGDSNKTSGINFYLQVKSEVERFKGIFPNNTGKVDQALKQAFDAYNSVNDKIYSAKYNHDGGLARTQMSIMMEIAASKTPQGLLTSQQVLDMLKKEYVTAEAVCKMKQDLLNMKLVKDHNLRLFLDSWEVQYRRLQEICSPDITDHTMTEYLPSAAELKKSLFNGLANLAQTLMISQQLGNGSLAMDKLSVLEYVDRIRQMTRQSTNFLANNVKAEMKSNTSSGTGTAKSTSVYSRLEPSTLLNTPPHNLVQFRFKNNLCQKCGSKDHLQRQCTEGKKGLSQNDISYGYDKEVDYSKMVLHNKNVVIPRCDYCSKNHMGECRYKPQQQEMTTPVIKMNPMGQRPAGPMIPIHSRLSGHENTMIGNSSTQNQARVDEHGKPY